MGGMDKLMADLDGRPLLAWTVAAMAAAAAVRRVILVTSPERAGSLAGEAWLRGLDTTIVPGGERRQDSVAAGVSVTDGEVVLVHDGARPFVSPRLVDAVAAAAAEHGAAVPVLPVVDSLKRVAGGRIAASADRTDLFRAGTPQGARRNLLVAACLELAGGATVFTDEAELLARYGAQVATVPGEAAALKITDPADLEVARALAESRAGRPRLGTGRDSHPFGPADGLRLAGVDIPEAPRLLGHSDGDAAVHAVCDALLAAVGLGDLGRLFPAGDPATRGIDSRTLLAEVVDRVAGLGWRPASLDLTILGARPRLGGARLERMREALSALLGLPPERVSVQAASGNLAGEEGAGRVISATALVSVVAR